MTERVQRADRSSLSKAKRLDSGALVAPARLTRTGVFTYHDPNSGRTWRELRLPEEVFAQDSIASFELVPVIDDHHPEIDGGAVNARNATKLAVGAVGHVTKDAQDPNYLSGTVTIWDAGTVDKAEGGKRELSCGYFCDREKAKPGSIYSDPVTKLDSPYDYIQRNIRGNHVALVQVGRAGPGARLLMDGANVVEIQTDGEDMHKIVIDGVTYEAGAQGAQIAEALSKVESQHKASLAKLNADSDSIRGERDALASKVGQLETELKAASDPKAVEARVAERLEISEIAKSHGVNADGLDLHGVRRSVVAKLSPETKLDGQSNDYVAGVFTALVKSKGRSVASAVGRVSVNADSLPATKTDRASELRKAFFTDSK